MQSELIDIVRSVRKCEQAYLVENVERCAMKGNATVE